MQAVSEEECLQGVVDLSEEMLTQVAEVAEPCDFPSEAEILTHGDVVADNFYVMTKGKVAILVPTGQTAADSHVGRASLKTKPEMKEVVQLTAPKSFGGIALLYGTPRTATVKALEDCQCFRINRKAFKMVLM